MHVHGLLLESERYNIKTELTQWVLQRAVVVNVSNSNKSLIKFRVIINVSRIWTQPWFKVKCVWKLFLIATIYSALFEATQPPSTTGQAICRQIFTLSFLYLPAPVECFKQLNLFQTGCQLEHLSVSIRLYFLCQKPYAMCINSNWRTEVIVCCAGISVFTTWNTSIEKWIVCQHIPASHLPWGAFQNAKLALSPADLCSSAGRRC